MSSVTQAYGANIAFIEELYERYRANPDSVSASWREFFGGNEAAEPPSVAAGFSRPADIETSPPRPAEAGRYTRPKSSLIGIAAGGCIAAGVQGLAPEHAVQTFRPSRSTGGKMRGRGRKLRGQRTRKT